MKLQAAAAAEQVEDWKARADTAEMNYLEASRLADEAIAEADHRTRKRQNRTPWTDEFVATMPPPAVGQQLPTAGSRPGSPLVVTEQPAVNDKNKNTLMVTILRAESVGLGSDGPGGVGGAVFCVVRIENWHSAEAPTTERMLPQQGQSTNMVSWEDDSLNDPGKLTSHRCLGLLDLFLTGRLWLQCQRSRLVRWRWAAVCHLTTFVGRLRARRRMSRLS